ncbi:TrbG/VirB9 family P-type conjugative transfer protein [Burkholderia cenocepacia]|uniref:TrbG/VirB9 family P-type conjugative transfer protein n=1 Tax=Burkholderia cenocepacia TaxID=95486 RepID=UPI0022EAF862|nr:TrbG/VirB9 family P-type conjugative transfer protein [Burkholderia cenocepacia]MDA3669898.1 TrbG/VirB9 family P-type conjugative transfer protein [Burkholderia cenocepacia]MDA3679849.1 TrbG/VirB9 family P-type conjugative transfer protein [Burkholderia cenocepacia]MDA3687685.1 TrbG/VirB9 family P-type conjugative transfer protein [Burkholderia cenocepacia]MDA3694912.1 TrbG/VirB9 family P-type conjugative transfer protein [Burkholderia cenocepacia]MDA3702033.1 TrbG/VirB9 family P-type conju
MKRTRSLLSWGALALIAASANAFAAKNAASPVSPIPGFDVGSIIGDAMSPVNPYNSGADPLTMPGDARMAVFPYSRDQIYRVMTAPLKLTTIELERGESLISEPAMGDSVQWVIDTDGANHVYVKPTKPGLVNTLHLSTNKREYELTLVSSPLGGLFYQNVRFNYPNSLMAKVRTRANAAGDDRDADHAGQSDSGPIGVPPDKLNFEYTVSGTNSLKPETVFDDGTFIWIRMPPRTPFAVPTINDGGDIVSPNFIRRGPYIVIQRLADEVKLTRPGEEVTITRGRRGLFGF